GGRRGGEGLRVTPVPASARQLRPHTEEARLERGELALTRQGLPAVKRLSGFRVLLSRETDHGEVVPQLDDGTIPAERFKELKTLPRITQGGIQLALALPRHRHRRVERTERLGINHVFSQGERALALLTRGVQIAGTGKRCREEAPELELERPVGEPPRVHRRFALKGERQHISRLVEMGVGDRAVVQYPHCELI